MTRLLPRNPSLAQLRNQARDLLRAFRAHDPQALSRVAQFLPTLTEPAQFILTRAQYIVAREYGFASWPKLCRHVAERVAHIETSVVLPTLPDIVASPPNTREKHAHLKLMAEHLRQKPHVLELTEQIVAYAAQHATEELVDAFARMPARLILAVRANIYASGRYTLLTDALIQALEHSRARVRQQAAQALDLLADERCIPALQCALRDPIPRVRRTALHALTCDDCKIVPLRVVIDLQLLDIL